ncbi:hypothetical protein DB346_02990 [Verrucomicrobia bacterium LW23]|nr:hypothetical protein DB346_03665 [Verrucomicrobia bacterium LW23]PTY04415.1 hypothetical protein DB346_02990 [Verrucomicrobia bacterium LW23]
MPYITQSDMEGMIPADYLLQGVDDNRDGAGDAGAWDKVYISAEERVHTPLNQRYTVPIAISPVPDILKRAAKVFAAELLYLRRGFAGDQNPWTKQAEKLDEKLSAIGRGEEPLVPEVKRELPSGGIIAQPSKTYSSTGSMAA